jgi:Metallo-beta-lactamase superfamily
MNSSIPMLWPFGSLVHDHAGKVCEVDHSRTSLMGLRFVSPLEAELTSTRSLGAEAKPNTTRGQYQQNLAAAGINAKAIDTVIISHYHPDHVNRLLGADDKPAFPNAEILVPAAEHRFWMNDGVWCSSTASAAARASPRGSLSGWRRPASCRRAGWARGSRLRRAAQG